MPIIENSSIVTQIQQFYKNIQLQKMNAASPPRLDIPGLLAELRGYQSKAVAWMQEREGVAVGGAEKDTSLHALWRELPLQEDNAALPQVYFNPYTSW